MAWLGQHGVEPRVVPLAWYSSVGCVGLIGGIGRAAGGSGDEVAGNLSSLGLVLVFCG